MSLFNVLLSEVPPHSMHVPICRYSYQMLKYFGAISFIIVQTHIHTIMFIPMRNNREVNAAYALTKNSTVISQITQFIDTIEHSCECVKGASSSVDWRL